MTRHSGRLIRPRAGGGSWHVLRLVAVDGRIIGRPPTAAGSFDGAPFAGLRPVITAAAGDLLALGPPLAPKPGVPLPSEVLLRRRYGSP
jgi:hypothetical protein